MSNRTTINVSKDAHRAASEAKREGESWSDYIQRCIDAETREDTARDVVAEIREAFGIEGDADVAELVTQESADVDESALAAALADDLVAQLPKPLAEELEGRLP